ncbi:BTB/POZ domain-containing protein 7-like isoform X2 [Centruroides sculpturatus]|uniref:BTB/POZ domain-containing protein 7-like isoform X1 n=1 Tax=Centruroides sculpturatus TaxID=218467 RepID=UPI000C6EEC90|nr:BTB/POZ domain-containing protein 7-like isoform X1 [Centruroides sculpturatus]XP_023216145.1 BTB/POZ domain-containing protein 7-like isoform X1 [Centruroides sculpturatus]XP_023216146.1 BTB/POZ domain-containing protein 7-like isoform X1 [Centruroides sculpturatus]XP_023216147.1 BTB/POZ domain-containing protein 7-like isoform X2 [Centruroides sculpturatus]
MTILNCLIVNFYKSRDSLWGTDIKKYSWMDTYLASDNLYYAMGVSTSSFPSTISVQQSEQDTYNQASQTQNACGIFSSTSMDQFSKEKKRKGTTLSTLRKRLTRRRRTSKSYDHGQIFREFLSSWPPRDIIALVEEYEATASLKELSNQAEIARPITNSCKQDLGELFQYKYCSDINLIYQGTVFAVHRAILAARCPFFRELLNSLSSICTEVAVDIDIAGVSVEMFNELLRYLYTGELSVAPTYEGNLSVLFQLSEQFGIPNPLEEDLRYLLETGIYSDVSIAFTSEMVSFNCGATSYLCDHSSLDNTDKSCKICVREAEFWCHRAILSARSSFFRNVIRRRQRSKDMNDMQQARIILDEAIIPRRYAQILIQALYQDTLDLGSLLMAASKRGNLPEIHLQRILIEEAMQLCEVARFIEMESLVQYCEDFIAESITLETLVPVLQWSEQPHGSPWVYRQALNFIREEFSSVAASPTLFQLERNHLLEVVKSDFLQASELEILQAVLKWGEQQLCKRVEEREPNIVSHTAHSVSRRGLRKRDLSDLELRELLSDLLCHVRIDHILPPDSELLMSTIKRGLISTPPSFMLGDDFCIDHNSCMRTHTWIRSRGSRGLYVRPRLFTPYVEEAKAWLEEQLGQEAEVGRRRVWPISHIPDTLYMVEKPLALQEGFVPFGHLCSTVAREHIKEILIDDCTLKMMKKREEELQQHQIAQKAFSLVSNHCDVMKQIQLRVVREFGFPDVTFHVLHHAPPPQAIEMPAIATGISLQKSAYSFDHGYLYGYNRGEGRQSVHKQKAGEIDDCNQQITQISSASCCIDHQLNEVIPDIAMATTLMEQLQTSEPETTKDNGSYSLPVF